MNLDRARTLAIELLEEHDLYTGGWYFEFDNSKRRFGSCQYRTKRITLSTVLTELNDEETVKDTILHEIAHALVGFNHHHDWVWKQKALEIGCDGERCYSVEDVLTPQGKYIAVCHKCNHVYNRFKKPREGVKQSCGKCGNGRFNPDLVLVWVQSEIKTTV